MEDYLEECYRAEDDGRTEDEIAYDDYLNGKLSYADYVKVCEAEECTPMPEAPKDRAFFVPNTMPTQFSEAYRDFVSRLKAGKLAPLRLDGDERDGKAYYAFPAMNGIYRLDIRDGKVIAIALF